MIQVNHLSFSYTKQPFISDMTFSVSPGEIFGFLGPSGAGKSTLQKVLTGMLASYQGSAMVNGVECRERTKDFYEDIGVDFEFSALYEKLTARENLRFFASLYEKKPCPIDELLETVGLERDGDKRVSQYSKGMKARLNFVRALLHDPSLLCLDEPTNGLDPANSRMMKDMILAQKAKGKTILNLRRGCAVFLRQDAQYIMSPLPSFWIGKAVFEDTLVFILPAFASSAVWIRFLLRRYLRKI